MTYLVAVYCKTPFPGGPSSGDRVVALSQEVMELQGQLSLGLHTCRNFQLEAHRLQSSQGDNPMAWDC